jgi:hypothetical protein
MAEPQTCRWTLTDLDALHDHDGWIRYEIIDEELFLLHAPSNPHQEICGLVEFEPQSWNRGSRLGTVLPDRGRSSTTRTTRSPI